MDTGYTVYQSRKWIQSILYTSLEYGYRVYWILVQNMDIGYIGYYSRIWIQGLLYISLEYGYRVYWILVQNMDIGYIGYQSRIWIQGILYTSLEYEYRVYCIQSLEYRYRVYWILNGYKWILPVRFYSIKELSCQEYILDTKNYYIQSSSCIENITPGTQVKQGSNPINIFLYLKQKNSVNILSCICKMIPKVAFLEFLKFDK